MKWSKYRGGPFRFALCLVLLCAGVSLCYPQAAEQMPPLQSQTQIISQLKADLTAALALVAQLKASLALRLSDLQTLQGQYTQAQAALTKAQTQLTQAEQSSQSTSAQIAQMQSDATSLQQSLIAIKSSLTSYKADTDKAVRNLELARNGWKIAGITFGVAATAEAIYIAGHALKAW
jgi:septal ring factor EnvC (AmiA/AmiB activator)